MDIKVLGTGCAKCKKLDENTREAVRQLGIDATIDKVTSVKDIMSYGVMSTPALVVDGIVKVKGQVPDVKTLMRILK
jgi:small redox-active disulfide protein 2